MPYFSEKRGRWCASKEINGQRRQHWCKTKAEAKVWEAAQNAESWTKAATQAVTVLEVCNRYLDDVKARMHLDTYKDKLAVCDRLLKHLPRGATVDDLTPKVALAYFAKQNRARGANPANRDRKNLGAMWAWASKMLRVVPKDNPFMACQKFPADQAERYVPPAADMEKILATETGEVRAYLLTLLHTAARRSELFRLLWTDLDLEAKTVRLGTRKRKGGALTYQKVPMSMVLREELSALKRTARGVFVFTDKDGQPFTSRQHLMGRVCSRAGVPYFSFHAIRHLSASMLRNAGVALPTIQAILRHQSATTTDRYLHDLMGVEVKIDHAFEPKVVPIKRALGGVNSEGSF